MPVFDSTNKRERKINGKYLVHTTAGNIDFSPSDNRRFMIRVFHYGADSANKTFYIEANGILLINDSVSVFNVERLDGELEKIKFERIS